MLEVSGPRPSVCSSAMFCLGLRGDQRLGVGQVADRDMHMVLQVLPDRQVSARLDAVGLQLGGDPDAGEHQQLRRVVGARREDHLAVGEYLRELVSPLVLDSDRAVAVEQDPGAQRVGDHLEVRAGHGGMQVGHRGAAPHPAALGQLVVADPVLLRPVEVVVGLMPGLLRRLDIGVHQGVPGPAVADGQRAAGAVQVARAALVVLGPQEVGQHVRPAPSGRAARRPLVVVGTVPADVDHRVHRRRAAQHLAAGQVPAPEVDARARGRSGSPSPTWTGTASRRPPGCGSQPRYRAGRPRSA